MDLWFLREYGAGVLPGLLAQREEELEIHTPGVEGLGIGLLGHQWRYSRSLATTD